MPDISDPPGNLSSLQIAATICIQLEITEEQIRMSLLRIRRQNLLLRYELRLGKYKSPFRCQE